MRLEALRATVELAKTGFAFSTPEAVVALTRALFQFLIADPRSNIE